MTKLHNLLKPVVNSKEMNLNENKRHGVTIWLWLTCLLFIISMVACAPSTSSGGGNGGGNQSDLIDLDLQFTGFQVNEKDKDEIISLLVGRDLNMAVEVTNQGKNEYQGIVTFYQSGDDEISTKDTLLDFTNFSLVGVGSLNVRITISRINLGTYYYGACIYFQDEENVAQIICTAAVQVVVRELDPGLALTMFQVNGKDKDEIISLLVGRDLNMAVQVTNQGKNEYQGIVTFYQANDNEINPNDNSLDSTNFSLVGGESWEATFTQIAPISAGTSYYGACLSFKNEENTNQITCNSAIQVDIRGLLENVFNVPDDENLKLDGARSVTTAEVGGTPYLFTAGQYDDGVSMFSVEPSEDLINLRNVFNVTNDGINGVLELDGVRSIATAIVEETIYLFTAGYSDDGVSMFRVDPTDESLINITNVTDDGINGVLELDGARSVTTAEVGGTIYLFVAGQNDDGVSVFSVKINDDGSLIKLINITNVTDDGINGVLELDGVRSIATAIVEGTPYLFTAGQDDDGISVFRVESSGDSINLKNVYNVSDAGKLELNEAYSIITTEVGGTTYLFVAGFTDDGISVFRVNE